MPGHIITFRHNRVIKDPSPTGIFVNSDFFGLPISLLAVNEAHVCFVGFILNSCSLGKSLHNYKGGTILNCYVREDLPSHYYANLKDVLYYVTKDHFKSSLVKPYNIQFLCKADMMILIDELDEIRDIKRALFDYVGMRTRSVQLHSDKCQERDAN